MLCSAMATASLRPRLTELIVLIATAMPSGKLCAVRVIAVSSPTRSRRRSDADVTASARMAGRHRTPQVRRMHAGAGGGRADAVVRRVPCGQVCVYMLPHSPVQHRVPCLPCGG